MTHTEIFLFKLSRIENELRQICIEHSELYEEYLGSEFPEQNNLAGVVLDNLIMSATDEISSHIGLQRERIKDLTKFINFRKKHNQFSDHQLEIAIDNDNLLADFKTALEKLPLSEKKIHLDLLKNIRSEWNEIFQNRFYRQLKESFQL